MSIAAHCRPQHRLCRGLSDPPSFSLLRYGFCGKFAGGGLFSTASVNRSDIDSACTPTERRQSRWTGNSLPGETRHQNWTGDSQPRTSSRKQVELHRSLGGQMAYVSAGDWRGGVSAQPSHRSQPGTVSQSVHIDLTFHSSQTHRPDVPPPSSRSQPNPVPTAQLTTHILAQSTRS